MSASHLRAFLSQTRNESSSLSLQEEKKFKTNLLKALINLFNGMPAHIYVNNDVSTLQQAATFLEHG
jgi:hypothetical protein